MNVDRWAALYASPDGAVRLLVHSIGIEPRRSPLEIAFQRVEPHDELVVANACAGFGPSPVRVSAVAAEQPYY